MRKPAVAHKPEFCPLQPAWHSSHDLIKHLGTSWIRFRLTDHSIRLEEGPRNVNTLVLSQHRAVAAAKILGLRPPPENQDLSAEIWPLIRIQLDTPFLKVTEIMDEKLLVSILVEVGAATKELKAALRTAELANANA